MALTISLDRGFESVQGNYRRNRLTASLDAAYPQGGYPCTPRQLGLQLVHDVQIQAQQGLILNYDSVNQKLRCFRSTAEILVNEATGTFAAGATYTSKYVPAYVLGVRGIGGAAGAKRVIPASQTPGAGQVAVNMTTGAFTWGDATLTSAQILYVPSFVPGFSSDLLVVEETQVAAAGAITLTNVPAAIQAIYDQTAAAPLQVIPQGGTPSASQFAPAMSTGILTLNAANNGHTILVTYSKAVGNPMNIGAQGNKGVNSLNVCGPTTDTSLMNTGGQAAPSYVLPSFGCQVCGIQSNGVTIIAGGLLVDPGGSAAAGVVVYNYFSNSFLTAGADAYTSGSFHQQWLYLAPENVGDYVQELSNNTNLSAITGLRIIAMGS